MRGSKGKAAPVLPPKGLPKTPPLPPTPMSAGVPGHAAGPSLPSAAPPLLEAAPKQGTAVPQFLHLSAQCQTPRRG